jgi:Plastocyanin
MVEQRTRRRLLTAVGASAVGGLAGCLSTFDRPEYDIGMRATAFAPETITVDAGTTVVWRNTSARGHTVTAYESTLPAEATFFASGGYESTDAAREAWHNNSGGRIETSETFSYTFEIPGEYGYVCIPHETSSMVGTVIVEE